MYTPELYFPDCPVCVLLRNYIKIAEEAEKMRKPMEYCRDIYYNYYEGCNEDEDTYGSPTNSGFEVLDPHDPTLSRLATLLFKRTNEYLQGEFACGGDHYMLLEEINRLAITKYTDLRNLAVNLNRTLTEYNELYGNTIRPLLSQVDNIDVMVARLEENAYRLDGYTKQLKTRIKDMYDTK